MTKRIVAIGGSLNGRRLDDGNYEPYETGPMDQETIKINHYNFRYKFRYSIKFVGKIHKN